MTDFTPQVAIVGDDKMDQVSADGGIIIWLELLCRTGILRELPRRMAGESQGWTDGQMMLAVMLLNTLGHDRVSDVDALEADGGLCELARLHEPDLLDISAEELEERFRSGCGRTFPSANALHDWLRRFHRGTRPPSASRELYLLEEVRWRLARRMIRALRLKELTLDLDATIVASGKREARSTYRAAIGRKPRERGFQPLLIFCWELGMVLGTEWREGDVPACSRNLELLRQVLSRLPPEIKRVTLRSDGAAYQRRLIRFLNDPKSRPKSLRRFGVIGFDVPVRMSGQLKAAVAELPEKAWTPVPGESGLECAELVYVSDWDVEQPRSWFLRYVATRRARPGELGVGHDEIPARDGRPSYQIRVHLSNLPPPRAPREGAGGPPMEPWEVVRFAQERCGRGEEIHAVLKHDMAGGMLPSGKFGVNAAWWHLAVLSANLAAALRDCALGENWLWARMKRVRRRWLHVASRLVRHARYLELRFSREHARRLEDARVRICWALRYDTS